MSIEPGRGEDVDLEVAAVAELDVVVPPEALREHALLNDPAIYEEAERDWKGWWVKQAKQLHWFREPTQDLDDSNPPFISGLATARSTRRITAWTVTSRPAMATVSHFIGVVRRARSESSRTLTFTGTCSGSPMR
jgi:hypothetical protein